jgi:spermidine synthase
MQWLFVFFFLSGFCSILYELIWLRLAMAQFGVTTALVSIMLSTFMAGLGAGSWGAGVLVRRYRPSFPPLRLYAIAELLIGISALLVPLEFRWGAHWLTSFTTQATMSSFNYYVASGAILAVSVIPWCACMGATIPLAMFAIKAERSFSFLYIANLVGSIAGCSIPLLLIERSGFQATLRVGAIFNFMIAAVAFSMTLLTRPLAGARGSEEPTKAQSSRSPSGAVIPLLFLTGFATMGMEVIWIRLFTPYVGPVVYSFAMILATYLAATFLGSRFYRWWGRTRESESRIVWVLLALLGLLPLLTSDSRFFDYPALRVILGIAPISGVIGFLTPMLVDRWSGGDAARAGRGYAINVLGCVLGPLVSGFVLLPLAGERWSMLLFALPWIAMAVSIPRAHRMLAYGSVVAGLAIFIFTHDFETQFDDRKVLRDSTATVIATGEDMERRLLVNGIGMTRLTPITKMMAHIPLAWIDHKPQDGLVICFGMGTSSLAMLSWGIRTTTVELVPSVPQLVGYFHPERAEELKSSRAHIVIDDGRRYLERSAQTYDVIVIDPPPPVNTAGSSLLYSVDFYNIAKQRLRPGGIFQQWLPEGDNELIASVAKALRVSFPQVRVYQSVEEWGWHFSASMTPLPDRTAEALAGAMPGAAGTDLMEWGPFETPKEYFAKVLSQPVSLDRLIGLSPEVPALQDDRPVNEYDWLRRHSRR